MLSLHADLKQKQIASSTNRTADWIVQGAVLTIKIDENIKLL